MCLGVEGGRRLGSSLSLRVQGLGRGLGCKQRRERASQRPRGVSAVHGAATAWTPVAIRDPHKFLLLRSSPGTELLLTHQPNPPTSSNRAGFPCSSFSAIFLPLFFHSLFQPIFIEHLLGSIHGIQQPTKQTQSFNSWNLSSVPTFPPLRRKGERGGRSLALSPFLSLTCSESRAHRFRPSTPSPSGA